MDDSDGDDCVLDSSSSFLADWHMGLFYSYVDIRVSGIEGIYNKSRGGGRNHMKTVEWMDPVALHVAIYQEPGFLKYFTGRHRNGISRFSSLIWSDRTFSENNSLVNEDCNNFFSMSATS